MEFLLCFLFPFVFIYFSFFFCQTLSFSFLFPLCLLSSVTEVHSPFRFSPAQCLALPSSKQWRKSSTCWEDLQPYFCQRKNADECSFVIFISIPITAFFSLFYLATFQCMIRPCDRYSLSSHLCVISFFSSFCDETGFFCWFIRAFLLRFFSRRFSFFVLFLIHNIEL